MEDRCRCIHPLGTAPCTHRCYDLMIANGRKWRNGPVGVDELHANGWGGFGALVGGLGGAAIGGAVGGPGGMLIGGLGGAAFGGMAGSMMSRGNRTNEILIDLSRSTIDRDTEDSIEFCNDLLKISLDFKTTPGATRLQKRKERIIHDVLVKWVMECKRVLVKSLSSRKKLTFMQIYTPAAFDKIEDKIKEIFQKDGLVYTDNDSIRAPLDESLDANGFFYHGGQSPARSKSAPRPGSSFRPNELRLVANGRSAHRRF